MKQTETLANPEKITKGQQTRVKIIEAATELFMIEGLYNVTIGKIAEDSGVTQSAVYRYFEDMDDILTASALHWLEISRVFIDDGVDPLSRASDQLETYIERNLVYASKHRSHDALFLGLYYYAMGSPRVMKVYKDLKDGGMGRIERVLKFGNIDGSWSISGTRDKANTIHTILVGEIIKLIIEPKDEKIEHRLKRVLGDVRLIIGRR